MKYHSLDPVTRKKIHTISFWRRWFNKDRQDLICAAFVRGDFATLFLKTAKRCGAYKGRFCADGSVKVFFNEMPKEII